MSDRCSLGYLFNDFMHVYSPRDRGRQPLGDKSLMSTERLYYFAHLLQVKKISYTSLISQSLNFGGRRGTTDDVAPIPFHPSLSSTALQTPFPSIPCCYLPICSSVFLSFLLLSLSLAELSSPCQRILRCGHTEFPFLYHS